MAKVVHLSFSMKHVWATCLEAYVGALHPKLELVEQDAATPGQE